MLGEARRSSRRRLHVLCAVQFFQQARQDHFENGIAQDLDVNEKRDHVCTSTGRLLSGR